MEKELRRNLTLLGQWRCYLNKQKQEGEEENAKEEEEERSELVEVKLDWWRGCYLLIRGSKPSWAGGGRPPPGKCFGSFHFHQK